MLCPAAESKYLPAACSDILRVDDELLEFIRDSLGEMRSQAERGNEE